MCTPAKAETLMSYPIDVYVNLEIRAGGRQPLLNYSLVVSHTELLIIAMCMLYGIKST